MMFFSFALILFSKKIRCHQETFFHSSLMVNTIVCVNVMCVPYYFYSSLCFDAHLSEENSVCLTIDSK